MAAPAPPAAWRPTERWLDKSLRERHPLLEHKGQYLHRYYYAGEKKLDENPYHPSLNTSVIMKRAVRNCSANLLGAICLEHRPGPECVCSWENITKQWTPTCMGEPDKYNLSVGLLP